MNKYDIKTLNDAEQFSDSLLKKKDDLVLLLNECSSINNFTIFDDLCFTGKYINGLLRVLKTGNTNPEVKSLDHVKKDLSDNMEKVISLLKEITLNSSEEIKINFEKKYFSLSPEAFANLTVLVSDLDATKKYLNQIKRKSID